MGCFGRDEQTTVDGVALWGRECADQAEWYDLTQRRKHHRSLVITDTEQSHWPGRKCSSIINCILSNGQTNILDGQESDSETCALAVILTHKLNDENASRGGVMKKLELLFF